MKIKFRDLYDAIKETKQAVTDMGLDLDNITCGEATCIVGQEVERLADSYMDLYNADVSFKSVDMGDLQNEIEDCMRGCVDF